MAERHNISDAARPVRRVWSFSRSVSPAPAGVFPCSGRHPQSGDRVCV